MSYIEAEMLGENITEAMISTTSNEKRLSKPLKHTPG